MEKHSQLPEVTTVQPELAGKGFTPSVLSSTSAMAPDKTRTANEYLSRYSKNILVHIEECFSIQSYSEGRGHKYRSGDRKS
jgi:hypothetical protein